MTAPGRSSILPRASVKPGVLPSALYRPLFWNCSSLRRGRGHQVAHVHLRAAVEHHAVAVDDHHRAVGLDLALDLRGARLRIVDAVQHRPVRILAELHRGVAADVEGLPVQDGLLAGLLDGDVDAAVGGGLHRRPGVAPAGGQGIGVHLRPPSARPSGAAPPWPARRRGPRAGPPAARRSTRRCAPGCPPSVAAARARPATGARAVRQPQRRLPVGQAARDRRVGLRRALGREPAAAERGGLGMGGARADERERGQRGRQRRAARRQPALEAGGGAVADAGGSADVAGHGNGLRLGTG